VPIVVEYEPGGILKGPLTRLTQVLHGSSANRRHAHITIEPPRKPNPMDRKTKIVKKEKEKD
jgi:hypothetical protein